MKEKIEIQLSKNKLLLGVVGSLLFVIVGIWLFLNTDIFQEHPFRLFRNPMVVKGVGILGFLFFGATGLFSFKKLFDKKAGLIIDSNGITDNSNASSIGLIEWNDITDIITKQVILTKFLMINVTNPEKYIGKAKSGMKATLLRLSMKMNKTPFSITSSNLKYDFGKLEKLLQTKFEQNKNVG